ncbi:MAG: tyrosine-type recombinase/integrase [Clostridia bacterium]|nr:tyrosine-type recombinase/integrase [Clostridia bacterium]
MGQHYCCIQKHLQVHIRVHDLRHSHASFLLSSGVPVTAVSKRLGHSSVTQTYNTYSHIMPQDHALIGSLLDGI